MPRPQRGHLPGLFIALSSLAIVIAACSANSASPSTTTSVSAGSRRDINVVVLIDRSGSTQLNGSREGIERAVWPATFFPNLGGTYSLSVMPIGFSTEATKWCDWPNQSGKDRLLSQSDDCINRLKSQLKQPIPANGATHFDNALKAAEEQLAKVRGRKFVLLVTDGEFAHAGRGEINCAAPIADWQNESCEELGNSQDRLNKSGAYVCSIFVRTPQSTTTSSQTLEWLRARQDSKLLTEDVSGCPASSEIDLGDKPWKLAEDIITWYAEGLAELQVRVGQANSGGSTKAPIEVPNGAAQIGVIGLKDLSGTATSLAVGGKCTLGAAKGLGSFDFQPVTTEANDGERCPNAEITGAGLAPNENSLIALFVPENQELAACTPNENGGGELNFHLGFQKLLDLRPRVVWVGKHGEVQDPNVLPDQYREGTLQLTESQVDQLASMDDGRIAFSYDSSLNPPGKGEAYSLLYESTVLRTGTTEGYAARHPVRPTIAGQPCTKIFERSLFQKFWLALLLAVCIVAFIVGRTIVSAGRIDLTGQVHVLDGPGGRTVARVDVSGINQAWFHIDDGRQIEPGKAKGATNWKLQWRKDATVTLMPETGSNEDWTLGTPKKERGNNAVEFQRVPLTSGTGLNVVRYYPEGSKMDSEIERALETEEEAL